MTKISGTAVAQTPLIFDPFDFLMSISLSSDFSPRGMPANQLLSRATHKEKDRVQVNTVY